MKKLIFVAAVLCFAGVAVAQGEVNYGQSGKAHTMGGPYSQAQAQSQMDESLIGTMNGVNVMGSQEEATKLKTLSKRMNGPFNVTYGTAKDRTHLEVLGVESAASSAGTQASR